MYHNSWYKNRRISYLSEVLYIIPKYCVKFAKQRYMLLVSLVLTNNWFQIICTILSTWLSSGLHVSGTEEWTGGVQVWPWIRPCRNHSSMECSRRTVVQDQGSKVCQHYMIIYIEIFLLVGKKDFDWMVSCWIFVRCEFA